MKADWKIALPLYKRAYSLCFFVLIALVRGITRTEEIGVTLNEYTALLAVIFFADTIETEKREQRGELFLLLPGKTKTGAILRRIVGQWVWLTAGAAAGYWIFFWQRPQTGTIVDEAVQYLIFLLAVSGVVLGFGILSMTVSSLSGTMFAGIGINLAVWILLVSKGAEKLAGWNPLGYRNRILLERQGEWWAQGEILLLLLALAVLRFLPGIIEKGVRG